MTVIQEVAEGLQYQRLGEGIVYSITTTNWVSSPTIDTDITITKIADDSDVTSAWTTSATPSPSGDVITLPEITVPAGADLGDYRVDVPFTVGGFSPGIPYIILRVTE